MLCVRNRRQAQRKRRKNVRAYLAGKISMKEVARCCDADRETVAEWVQLRGRRGGCLSSAQELSIQSTDKARSGSGISVGQREPGRSLQKYHVRSKTQPRDWMKMYNAHGDFNSVKQSGGGSCMKQGRDTTQEERIQIVKDCPASGRNYGEMALKYKVSYQQVRIWTLRFEQLGEAGLEDRRGRLHPLLQHQESPARSGRADSHGEACAALCGIKSSWQPLSCQPEKNGFCAAIPLS